MDLLTLLKLLELVVWCGVVIFFDKFGPIVVKNLFKILLTLFGSFISESLLPSDMFVSKLLGFKLEISLIVFHRSLVLLLHLFILSLKKFCLDCSMTRVNLFLYFLKKFHFDLSVSLIILLNNFPLFLIETKIPLVIQGLLLRLNSFLVLGLNGACSCSTELNRVSKLFQSLLGSEELNDKVDILLCRSV